MLRGYWRAVETAVNFVLRRVPICVSTVMQTTAMRAAMRPYSIAVAPDSSFAKRLKRVFMVGSLPGFTAVRRPSSTGPIGTKADHKTCLLRHS